MEERWYGYIIECKGGERYVGIAKDVKVRVSSHNKGRACRYTKHRTPVKLRFKEKQESYSLARKREREIKGFNRVKKLALIRADVY